MNLKELREKKGLTQTDVAMAVGASLSSYRNWEIGVTKPTAENETKLKKVLEMEGEKK